MNVVEFLERAETLLLADEARHNLLLGIAGTVRDQPDVYADAHFWLVDGAVAMQTPPYNVIVAKPRDRAALAALVEEIDVDLPGVTAAVPEVDAFVELWGRPAELVRSDNIWSLHELREPPPVAGTAREASDDDLDLLLEWWSYVGGPAELVRQQVEQRLDAADGGITLWEVDGEPVSLCGYGSPTPNGIRIGLVFTPPERRRRGYAAAVTADVSRRQLARRRFCFLYTDAANATAERIYARLGYTRVCESRQFAFA
jgi:GNAT superfamily N-acetyltransferase